MLDHEAQTPSGSASSFGGWRSSLVGTSVVAVVVVEDCGAEWFCTGRLAVDREGWATVGSSGNKDPKLGELPLEMGDFIELQGLSAGKYGIFVLPSLFVCDVCEADGPGRFGFARGEINIPLLSSPHTDVASLLWNSCVLLDEPGS
jgi:hypothetical protein